MAYLALYRKYRPNNFDDVVGQKNVVEIIKNAIINNKNGHAYLFFGPRGTGKTTVAKIFAKMVNCENLENGNPCEKCKSCLNFFNNNDIVEIDAASNNGIDEIRELKNKINLVPSNCKYKVYIIDEVHMLTIQAFNALLKTLEEPPSHAIFILATTEPYKIPLTVTSRCQKFQFSKINNEEIVEKLISICKNENVSIDKIILTEIARLSDGGLRDAINILDQLISYKLSDYSLKDLYDINGTVSYVEINDLLLDMYNKNNSNVIKFVEKINNEGKNISKFIEELIIFLKDILIYRNTKNELDNKAKQEIINDLSKIYNDDNIYVIIMELNDAINRIKTSNYSNILLTLTLLKIIKDNFNFSNTNLEIGETNNNFDNEIIKFKKNKLIDQKNEIEDKLVKSNIINKEFNENTEMNNTIDNKKILIDNNFKQIRINNAFATASKTILTKLKRDWNKKENFLLNKNYGVIVGLLEDVEIVVAGDSNLILMSNLESIADRLNGLFLDLEKLLSLMYNQDFKVIVLSSDEWKNEKEKYINNIKIGIKYDVIEEISNNKNKNKNTPVDKLVDLFGEEMIEYK